MPACMTTQTHQEITVKSGKGASHGVVSELTAFLRGAAGARGRDPQACARYGAQFRDPSVNWQVGWKVLSLAGGRRRRMLDG